MVAFERIGPLTAAAPEKKKNHSNQSIAKSEEATVIKLSVHILEVISYISFAHVSDLSFIVFPWRPSKLEIWQNYFSIRYEMRRVANSPTGNEACSRPV